MKAMLVTKSIRILRKTNTIHCRLKSNLAYLKYKTDIPLHSKTIGQLLEESAEKYGNRPLVIAKEQNVNLSFEECLQNADKFAAGLKSIGLKYGDNVGIWAPNMVEWFVASMACARGGFSVVALNPALQSTELKYCINKVNVKCIICPGEMKHHNFKGILKEILPELDSTDQNGLNSTIVPSLKSIIFTSKEHMRGAYSFDDVLNMASGESIRSIKDSQHKIEVHNIANIQFTSGTTGNPKAIPRTHFQAVNNSLFTGKRLQLDEKHHRFCWQIPNFHAFALIVATTSLHYGSPMIYPSISYNPKENLNAIKDENCTFLLGTPTMFVDLLREQSLRNEKISPDTALLGGAVASPQLLRDIQSILNVKTVKNLYGLTESLSAFVSLPGEDSSKVYSTVGHIMEQTEAKVVDSNDNTVAFGVPGELCLKGYCILDTYLGDQQRSEESIDADGWFKTGDQFVLFEDGYGNIVGRIKDMIIRGGENIYPKEIEDYLLQHPNILEVYVVGVPHERLGEEVCACITTKDGSELTVDEIKKYCDKKIAYFKIPTMVVMMQSFPKTTSGKVQKYKLREKIVSGV